MSTNTTARRYRVPTATACAEVSLDEFSIEDIREYLRERETGCAGIDQPDELAHIETLVVCGQREAAREEALRLVGEAIGRKL